MLRDSSASSSTTESNRRKGTAAPTLNSVGEQNLARRQKSSSIATKAHISITDLLFCFEKYSSFIHMFSFHLVQAAVLLGWLFLTPNTLPLATVLTQRTTSCLDAL